MPFFREYDIRGELIINRDRTGPPAPPTRGRVQSSDGAIVGDSDTVEFAPAKPIPVKMPSPREPVLNADGTISSRWWRFLEELHRRTGYLEDNINWADTQLGLATTGSAVLSGSAPSAEITHIRQMPVASQLLTGLAPTVSIA